MRPRLRATSRERTSRPRSPLRATVVPGSIRRGGTQTTLFPTRQLRMMPSLATSTLSNVTRSEPSIMTVLPRCTADHEQHVQHDDHNQHVHEHLVHDFDHAGDDYHHVHDDSGADHHHVHEHLVHDFDHPGDDYQYEHDAGGADHPHLDQHDDDSAAPPDHHHVASVWRGVSPL